MMNVFILVLLGIIELVVYIISMSLAPAPPLLVAITLNMHPYYGEYSTSNASDGPKQLKSIRLDSNIFAIVKSFSIIVWYFLSNYFIKRRKVTTVCKVMKWFYLELAVYFAFYAGQVFYSYQYMHDLEDHQAVAKELSTEQRKEDWSTSLTFFSGLVVIILLVFMILCALLLYKLRKYNNGMIEFHKFINTYRQTPRSRNLKKYKPPQEPIYEEISQFERSHFGSVQVTSDLGSSFHNQSSSQHRNIITASNNTKDENSVNNITMSIHGGHASAIEYNEKLERFEEVPVGNDGEQFRGSMPNEDMVGPGEGVDIPEGGHLPASAYSNQHASH